MDNNTTNCIIDLIVFAIFAASWLINRSRKNVGTPKPEPEAPAAPEAIETRALPAEARELLSHEAARTAAGAGTGAMANPYAGDPVRASIYNELKLRDSEDLLQEWYDDDPSRWSDEAFEVMEHILIQRLGRLPARDAADEAADDEPALDPGDDVDPGMAKMWLEGDLDGLAQALKREPDWLVRMDAAEGLAAWGDARGYNYLVNALGDSADDVRGVASEILAALPPAPGEPIIPPEESAAYSETAADKMELAVEPTVSDRQEPASASDIWTNYRRNQDALENEKIAKAPAGGPKDYPSTDSPAGIQTDSHGSGLLSPNALRGATGGALGFLGFSLLLSLFGSQLQPDLPGIHFVQQIQLWLIPIDLVVGALGGALGGLLAQSLVIVQSLDQQERTPGSMLWPALAGLAGAGMANALLVVLGSL